MKKQGEVVRARVDPADMVGVAELLQRLTREVSTPEPAIEKLPKAFTRDRQKIAEKKAKAPKAAAAPEEAAPRRHPGGRPVGTIEPTAAARREGPDVDINYGTTQCLFCKREFEKKRPWSKYCSMMHRVSHWQQKNAKRVNPTGQIVSVGGKTLDHPVPVVDPKLEAAAAAQDEERQKWKSGRAGRRKAR